MSSRGIQRLKACREGAAAAEFAVVLPALLMLMFGAIQAGLLIFSYNMMVSAARDEVRAMAVCSTDPTTAATQVLTKLPPWIGAGAWTVNADNTAPNATMTISVPSSLAMLVSYVPFAPETLTATVTMLQEPNGYGGGSCSAQTG